MAPHCFQVAERLLAHARLCRHIAEQSWSEESAEKLSALADACTRAAAQITQESVGRRDH